MSDDCCFFVAFALFLFVGLLLVVVLRFLSGQNEYKYLVPYKYLYCARVVGGGATKICWNIFCYPAPESLSGKEYSYVRTVKPRYLHLSSEKLWNANTKYFLYQAGYCTSSPLSWPSF